MNADELAEIVENLRVLGSDVADIEVKKAQGGFPRSLRDTLSAFSNTLGGVIILGLDEAGAFAATGLANPSKMARYEVQMMLSFRGQPMSDVEPVRGVGPEALDERLVAAMVLRLRSSRPYASQELSSQEILRRMKVTVADGTEAGDVVSLGGLLALGSYPQEHFPQLMLTVVHYPSERGSDEDSGIRFVDSVAIEGPIPVMVRDALVAIRRNMSRRSIVTGAGRQDTWEYPETALREAVTNALVHRDLSPASRGAQVQVEMFPDRLVIRNPGGLFGPVTLDNLGEEGATSSRNAALLRILEDVPIPGEDRTVCENRGSGIRAMVNSLRKSGTTAPKFDDRISSFIVTFPNHSLLGDEAVQWIGSLGEERLAESQCMALAALRAGTVLDNPTYRKLTGLDSRVATSELQDLVARELVEQVGTRRWARYSAAPRLEADEGARKRRSTPADRRGEILEALGTSTASRAELAERTGLTDQTVRRWLTLLRKEGLVEATEKATSSRNTKYRRVEQGRLFS